MISGYGIVFRIRRIVLWFVCLKLLWYLEAPLPRGAFYLRRRSRGIVSKRLGSRYRSGRSPDGLKFKNPEAPAVRREAEEDWSK